MTSNRDIKVLVTGASGYLATHCVKQLVEKGYSVRGTVRSLQNEKKVAPVRALCPSEEQLELVEADLLKAETWTEALRGCDYVLHVASPFPIVADESVIQTAVNGTLNVLRAAAEKPSVKKVVLTSSCAAVNEGHPDMSRVFSEEDWTDVESASVTCYPKSKTLAEKAAWDFVAGLEEGRRFKLTCINPTLIVGPLLVDEQGASVSIVRRFMNFEMPAVPHLQLALVDVRDVARAHVIAMVTPESDGHRILVTAQPSFWFKDIAKVLAKEFSRQGYRLPSLTVPYPLVWLYSLFDSQTRAILERIGYEVKFNNSKAKTLFGINFIDPATSLVEMAYSMIDRGILPRRSG
ncbi:hypothetical protein QR680_017564 [Steinernema hermaphroditum]|uniref:NAD-dependent epimerase/dehydratase domain-containing protein n=1 Tax=Steinernema hermaphroditum TaxID=289476 RepID=A0AA39LP95_9BILA|nr:hypothetical protein QR680_017564 [Steinernema hermaphroditum]